MFTQWTVHFAAQRQVRQGYLCVAVAVAVEVEGEVGGGRLRGLLEEPEDALGDFAGVGRRAEGLRGRGVRGDRGAGGQHAGEDVDLTLDLRQRSLEGSLQSSQLL